MGLDADLGIEIEAVEASFAASGQVSWAIVLLGDVQRTADQPDDTRKRLAPLGERDDPPCRGPRGPQRGEGPTA